MCERWEVRVSLWWLGLGSVYPIWWAVLKVGIHSPFTDICYWVVPCIGRRKI